MKKSIKKITAVLCAFALAFSCIVSLSSCKKANEDDGIINIVCTAFPQYDWLKAVIGDDDSYSLSLLVDNGSDIHSYQPTVADRVEIAECDILVSIGGESDAWVEEMLLDSDARLIRLFEIPDIMLREISEEGILSEHIHEENEHEHEHDHDREHSHGTYDEHVWLSLHNAEVCVEFFKKTLSEMTPDKADALCSNADTYIASIKALEGEYRALAENTENARLIFADRFPFAYLAGDLGIEFCAAFEGCSTENNADFSTVTRLAERANEWNSKYIFVTETSDGRLASSVIAASGQEKREVLVMDSMQSVTRARIVGGESYISIMRKNLDVLRTALS